MKQIITYVVLAGIVAGGFFGWVKMREKHAAERAVWELRITELVADAAVADSVITVRNRVDSVRIVVDSSRLDTLQQLRGTLWVLRGELDQATDSVSLLRGRFDLSLLPDSIRALILAERDVGRIARAEADSCALALTQSDSLRLSCDARVAARDSTISLVVLQRDSALTLIEAHPKPPTFMERLPGEALKAGIFTGLGILIAILLGGGG